MRPTGWMVVTTGWALACCAACWWRRPSAVPGANLNPAITLAAAVISGDYSQVLTMWSAQLLGAMGGAALMALHYAPHWKLTPGPADKLGIFCTNAAVRSPAFNIPQRGSGHGGAGGGGRAHRLARSFSHRTRGGPGPWLVASLVWGIGLSLGGTTGYAINPARDLGPRLVHWLLADSRQGRLELALCADSDRRRPCGRRAGGLLLHYAHL
jgi:glycerol uptake facilitator protein